MLSNSGQEEGLRRKGDMAESEKQLWPERGWGQLQGTWAEPSALGSGPLRVPKERSLGDLLETRCWP